MALSVGSECEVAEKRRARLRGLVDPQVVSLAYVPVVRPVTNWNRKSGIVATFTLFIVSLNQLGRRFG